MSIEFDYNFDFYLSLFLSFCYVISVYLTFCSLEEEYKEFPPASKEDKEADIIWALTPVLNLFLIDFSYLSKK